MIKVNNISFIYNENQPGVFEALKDVSLKINAGDFIAIVGHTGSGKSTLIQTLNALLIPTKGSIDAVGFHIEKKVKIKDIKSLRKKVGIVFQFPEYQLFESTIEEDIIFGPKNFKISEEDKKGLASKMLSLVGLNDTFLTKSPFEISGGEKRRVAIAGILASNPEVLIVDEPTAGLDPEAANNMMELFKKLNKEENKTIILVTHQMDDVLKYANYMVALKDGQICAQGTPSDIFSNFELLKKLNLDVPEIIKTSRLIKEKYPDFDILSVKDIDSFITALKDVRK